MNGDSKPVRVGVGARPFVEDGVYRGAKAFAFFFSKIFFKPQEKFGGFHLFSLSREIQEIFLVILA